MFAKTALEIGAGDEIRERLVLGHLLDGELAEAARRYEAIIQASPGQEGALLRRMGGLFLVADVARARDAFERAVAAAPTDGDAWLGLGLARARLGDRAGCREALARAIAHGCDLGIVDAPLTAPAPSGKVASPPPRPPDPDRWRSIRAGAFDAAVELFPRVRDRCPRLATRFPPDDAARWDLVASVGVALFAVEPLWLGGPSDDYAAFTRPLFTAETRRKTFSPTPPARQQAFNAAWERQGHALLMDGAFLVASETRPHLEALATGGLSEREARGVRTRLRDAEERVAAEWVLRRMYDTPDSGEAAARLAEVGRWLFEAGRRISG